MKKIFLISFFVLLGLIASSPSVVPTLAQADKEVVGVGEDSQSDTKVEGIKDKVEELVEEGQSGQKKAFFGQIADIFNHTVILQTHLGQKTAKIEEDAEIINEGRKEINFDDLEIGTYVIAMGFTETPEKLLTKRLVVTPKPLRANRLALIGRITAIENEGLVIEPLGKDTSWEIEITGKTVITQKIDSKIRKVDFEEITENTLVVIGGISKGETELEAKAIHLLSLPESSPTPTPEEEEE